MFKPRLISREQAKIVAGAGGVIGVLTHLTDSPLEYAQNVGALVDVVGIDHVCIGTDTKLTPSYRPPGEGFDGPRPGQEKSKRRDTARHDGPPQAGPGGPGPKGQGIRERSNMAWKDQTTGFYFAIVDAMLKTGFNAEEISKFGGGN